MPPVLHSSFSASSSARLLACPGSYELGMRLDDGSRKSTIYSAEGTLAHAIGEVCIGTGKDPADFIGEERSADGFDFTIDDEFAEHVQVYVDYIRGLRALGFVVMLEQRVDPTVQWDGLQTLQGSPGVDKDGNLLPPAPVDLFGTADCIAYNPSTRELVIGDLKFGAGVPVEVEANSQLMYYGSGASHDSVLEPLCRASGVAYNGVANVTLTVIQPRAFHRDGPVRRYSLPQADLRLWARTVLYAGVQKALNDKGQTLDAGSWCRFCPVLAHCSKPAQLSFDTAQAAFLGTPVENLPLATDQGAQLPGAQLSDDTIAELLDKVAIIEPWLKALKTLGQERLESGKSLDGWKLVPKRALRRWAGDETEMRDALKSAGLNPDDFQVSKMKTPAQVEKAVGKKDYAALVAPHVVKNSSGVTLASEGDPRTRIQKRSAQAAFAPQGSSP